MIGRIVACVVLLAAAVQADAIKLAWTTYQTAPGTHHEWVAPCDGVTEIYAYAWAQGQENGIWT
jgi:hypothetical protein